MDASLTITTILDRLQSSVDGLSEGNVLRIRETAGWNALPQKKKSLFLLFLHQFQDVLVYILIGALVLTVGIRIASGDTSLTSSIDSIAIFAILMLNAGLGFFQEYRSSQALEGLKNLTSPQTRVRRGGKDYVIASKELVPGDIVILETGDRISADGRLLSVSHLEINESSLTGESAAVAKIIEALNGVHPIAEQKNMVFAGTLVTNGSGTYVVTAIGLQTEIGHIASLVSASEAPPTPLERRMKRLSMQMGIAVLILCAVLSLIQWQRGVSALDIILLAVSLAVSAVPEGLPAVVTACLAMGVRRMTALHALVMRLDALETLGSISVICSDKTGTITENKMKVQETWVSDHHGDDDALLIQIAASCNRAQLPNLGDPTEIGLLQYAEEKKVDRLLFDEEEMPFSSESLYMQTRHGTRSFLKGAPERILDLCTDADEKKITEQSKRMALRGLRVLAMAVVENNAIRFVGLMGLEDPPRDTVRPAMLEARSAGIRTMMITGDHADTASAVAAEVGITGDVIDGKTLDTLTPARLRQMVKTVSVYARVSPSHKISILKALQENGQIVAMTGDGVNDAPALKAADVGIAMGRDGTQVAREAASLILMDDNYATIVAAIREGRRIYDNIRKFILYLVRANVGQILLFTATVALGLPLPLLPVHILWINLMTDGLPALALGMEREEPGIMHRQPRNPHEQIFTGVWMHLLMASLVSCGLTFLLFLWALSSGDSIDHARTMVFTFSILFEILLAYHSRSTLQIWMIGIFKNQWLNAAAILPFLLQIILVFTPLRAVFALTLLSSADLVLLCILGISGLLFLEITKPIFTKHPKRSL
jgi:Ca2+-transporting ATPase